MLAREHPRPGGYDGRGFRIIPLADEVPLPGLFHYTGKDGWNAIRARKAWRFRASQPRDPARPVGAYFSDIEPSEASLRVLPKQLRIPKTQQEYVFWLVGTDGLTQLFGGKGRDRRIYFSPIDYEVVEERQKHGDRVELLRETFQ